MCVCTLKKRFRYVRPPPHRRVSSSAVQGDRVYETSDRQKRAQNAKKKKVSPSRKRVAFRSLGAVTLKRIIFQVSSTRILRFVIIIIFFFSKNANSSVKHVTNYEQTE